MGNDLAESKPQPLLATERGLQLRSFEDMWRFASAVSKSGLAPKDMESPEKCLIAIQYGAELGLSPMASIQRIAPINGRPTLYGDGLLAVCQSSATFDYARFTEQPSGTPGQDDYGWTTTVARLGGALVTRRFTIADAKRARLWAKQGPWTFYPDRMLQMRARAFACRDCFAAELSGIGIAEEVQDTPEASGIVTGPTFHVEVDAAAPRAKALATRVKDALPKQANPEAVKQVAALKAAKEIGDATGKDLTPVVATSAPQEPPELIDGPDGPEAAEPKPAPPDAAAEKQASAKAIAVASGLCISLRSTELTAIRKNFGLESSKTVKAQIGKWTEAQVSELRIEVEGVIAARKA